ncbi:MAG: UDP-3-O-(3-hydroxymyristoyl)glucosamine N-acyltransferase [Desulfuromonadales bacterium]|nr:UDP-3-O-(3-hydroxymyristoyl)glucosamine N-acyltransferase [Desulfuromonadales bacterium]
MCAERREKTSLAVLADLVGGCVSGDPSTAISGVAPLDSAGPEQISFLSNPKFQSKLADCQAAAIIVHSSLQGSLSMPLLLTANPYLAFAKILTFFEVPPHVGLGVMAGAHVHPEARIGANVTIEPGCVVCAGALVGDGTHLHPNVVIGADAVIGNDCLLHANVTVREKCVLGNRVILQPGAVIGADGFGFAPDGQGYYKIPQVGHVVIEDDVEIGACSCIDRGTLGVTRIARGVKIDNLVQIAHNVQLGEHTVMAAQVGIAGSTAIGKHCTFGGQAAVAGHVKVGDNVTLAGRGGIANNADGNQSLAGLPAMPHREWLKATMTLTRLPEMRRELQQLKKQVEELKSKLSENEG